MGASEVGWHSSCGLQVGSTVWAFGKTLSATKPGVFGIPPQQDTLHSYRETICLGYTKLSQTEYKAMIGNIGEEDLPATTSSSNGTVSTTHRGLLPPFEGESSPRVDQ